MRVFTMTPVCRCQARRPSEPLTTVAGPRGPGAPLAHALTAPPPAASARAQRAMRSGSLVSGGTLVQRRSHGVCVATPEGLREIPIPRGPGAPRHTRNPRRLRFWNIFRPRGNVAGRLIRAGMIVKKSSLASWCAGLLVAAALSACSSPNAGWQKASTQGTVAAYRSFIRHHPEDPRAQQARNRIDALEDTHAWRAARSSGTERPYQRYLAQYPAGAYTTLARNAIITLRESNVWQRTRTADTAAGYRTFLQRFPDAPEADKAQIQLDTLAGYQVQLGRYRSASIANAAAKRLKTRSARLLATLEVIPPSGSLKLTTLRSEQVSRAAALGLCAKLRQAGQGCSVVKFQARSGGPTLSGL